MPDLSVGPYRWRWLNHLFMRQQHRFSLWGTLLAAAVALAVILGESTMDSNRNLSAAVGELTLSSIKGQLTSLTEFADLGKTPGDVIDRAAESMVAPFAMPSVAAMEVIAPPSAVRPAEAGLGAALAGPVAAQIRAVATRHQPLGNAVLFFVHGSIPAGADLPALVAAALRHPVPGPAGIRTQRVGGDLVAVAPLLWRGLVPVGAVVSVERLSLVRDITSAGGSSAAVAARQDLFAKYLVFLALVGLIWVLTYALIARPMIWQSTHDLLTRLLNRHTFKERFASIAAATRKKSGDMALIVLDGDRFKQVNDRFGHPRGDVALQAIAEAIEAAVPSGALTSRVGGEEFVILLPGADLGQAQEIVETIRARVAQHTLPDGSHLTASAGVATAIESGAYEPGRLFRYADQGLYRAKAEGRDCVRVYRRAAAREREGA